MSVNTRSNSADLRRATDARGPDDPPAGRRVGPVALAGLLAAATGLAFIVGRHGTPGWQLARVVAVVGITALEHRVLRRGGVAAGWVALAFGVVAMPAGLGFGIQHVDKTGLSVGSVAGLLTLLGGTALIGAGGVLVVRHVGRSLRLPAVLAIVATVTVATWVIGQAVAATNVPPTHLGATTPADRGLAYEDVTFPTPDGVTLSGWYIPSKTGAAVAVLHGSGSTRSATQEHARVLAEAGFGVLAFDARGHGRSDGVAMDRGWHGDDDVMGAVTYLVGRPDVDPEHIALLGLSMGGEEAIGAAAADDRVRAVVAEGATGRVAPDQQWLVERYGWRGSVTLLVDWLHDRVTDLLTDARPPIALRQAAASSATPMLLVAAESVPSEPAAAAHIQAGSPDTVEVWVVPDGGHTGGLAARPAEWGTRVVGFLDAALRRGS